MAARTKAMLIRLSEKEQAEIRAAAKADGTPVATWGRRSLLRRARRVLEAATTKAGAT